MRALIPDSDLRERRSTSIPFRSGSMECLLGVCANASAVPVSLMGAPQGLLKNAANFSIGGHYPLHQLWDTASQLLGDRRSWASRSKVAATTHVSFRVVHFQDLVYRSFGEIAVWLGGQYGIHDSWWDCGRSQTVKGCRPSLAK
uniref:Uncharacterized protein n=1 Tax=Oryza glumipatula TaxID=40148 RepID=A0A0E0BNZ0_9ORYZ